MHVRRDLIYNLLQPFFSVHGFVEVSEMLPVCSVEQVTNDSDILMKAGTKKTQNATGHKFLWRCDSD